MTYPMNRPIGSGELGGETIDYDEPPQAETLDYDPNWVNPDPPADEPLGSAQLV